MFTMESENTRGLWPIDWLTLSIMSKIKNLSRSQAARVSRKLRTTETLLLQICNRMCYMTDRTVPFLMTLSDLQGHSPIASPFKNDFCAVKQQLTGFQLT